ncbi:hypothetical protein PoB_000252500 [Plakobranchus ocellatus]|uniref:Uncharacterized protein n=1 Tax=Plakobranchus ocellatus TaxID=259542 RepID=A0AAV3XZD5_9GAST|nr:hypothetical protein PoB_000252500 [Plakobranchus ocellatus]
MFKGYWSHGDKREQRRFILKHVERCLAIRKRVGSNRRIITMNIFFYSKDSRVQVCRHFLMNTLSVSKDFIYGALKQHSNGVLTPPKQGRHDKHKKVKETVVQDVRDHINSFAAIDSHYCRAKTNKKYLDASLSVAKMYRLYEEAYKEHERAPLDKYRRIFDEEFNLAFHKPKKDQCEICTSQRNNPTGEEKESFEEHLSNKLKAREMNEQEKLAAKTPFKTSCAFDMEQILLCPLGQS